MDEVFELIEKEEKRQAESLMLIPSENYESGAVLRALGSVLGNKYAEGYPGRRYYQGNEVVDKIEMLAQERLKKLFGFEVVNVQPYSGSPANSAVLMALMEPGETVMGMKLTAGGHLTHGHPRITFSGKFFRSVQYGVGSDGRIDFDEVREIAAREKPKVIFVGTTAYPYKLEWQRFAEIADEVGAYLVADMSHIAGLVAGGAHESPIDFAHVVTSTTHKTFRGPRGAFIGVTRKGMVKDSELAKKIDKAVFPGLQGGPHMNTIAALAVATGEALKPEFGLYARQVVTNAGFLAESLRSLGLKIWGSENHLMLVEVGREKGKEMAVKLEQAGIVVNANTVPFETGSAMNPSGIRIGTPAMTSRGMKEEEMKMVAQWISRVMGGEGLELIKLEVEKLCKRFPIN